MSVYGYENMSELTTSYSTATSYTVTQLCSGSVLFHFLALHCYTVNSFVQAACCTLSYIPLLYCYTLVFRQRAVQLSYIPLLYCYVFRLHAVQLSYIPLLYCYTVVFRLHAAQLCYIPLLYCYTVVFRLRALQLPYIPLLSSCTVVRTVWRVLTLWVADRPTDVDGCCENID